MSTSGPCNSAFPAPRSSFGFPSSSTDACSRPLRLPSDTTGNILQCVDNLTVRNTLVASHQRVGDVVVTGSGTPNPAFEAALRVRTGAKIDGLSQHGMLRVDGDSCMSGPLAVSQLYGPVNVGTDPSQPAVTTDVLTVTGNLTSDVVTTDAVFATSAAVGDTLTVRGYAAGPFADSTIAAAVQSYLVSIYYTPDAGTTKFVNGGVLVSANKVITLGTWVNLTNNSSDNTPVVTGHLCTVTLLVPRAGNTSFTSGAVMSVMPTGNVAIIDVGDSFSGSNVHATLTTDEPAIDQPVVIATMDVDPKLQTFSFVPAVITQTHFMLWREYTSLVLRTPQILPNGLGGAGVFDLQGNLVGVIQSGGSSLGTSYYSTILSAIKPLYLSYFLTQGLVASPPAVVDFNYVTSGLVSYGIGAISRALSSGLAPGGVTSVPPIGTYSSITSSQQFVTYSGANGTEPGIRLGSLGQNNPALSELIFQTGTTNPTGTVVIATSGNSSSVGSDLTPLVTGKWTKGPPTSGSSYCSLVVNNPKPQPNYISTNYQYVFDNGLFITSSTFNIQNTSLTAPALGGITLHSGGRGKDSDSPIAYVNWGQVGTTTTSGTLANYFFNLNTSFYESVVYSLLAPYGTSDKVLLLLGQSGTQAWQGAVVSNLGPSTTFSVDNTSSFVLSVVTNSTTTTVTLTDPQPLYIELSFFTTATAGACSSYLTSGSVTYEIGGAVPDTITAVTTAPTPLL